MSISLQIVSTKIVHHTLHACRSQMLWSRFKGQQYDHLYELIDLPGQDTSDYVHFCWSSQECFCDNHFKLATYSTTLPITLISRCSFIQQDSLFFCSWYNFKLITNIYILWQWFKLLLFLYKTKKFEAIF